MSNRLLGIHIPENIHKAAHTSATLHGVTLKEWLVPIILENLHPDAAALFLRDGANQNQQNQSSTQPPAA